MTRYAPDHKAQSRAKIVEAARAEFRANGFDGLSIDRLMKAAGLTRGAFYAHFTSKEALVEEVLGIESGLVAELRTLGDGDREGALAKVAAYLSPSERASRVQCPFVAHAMDAFRGGQDRAALYEAHVSRLLAELQRTGSTDPHADVARLVGAALLSTAVTSDTLAAGFETAGALRCAD